MTREGLFDLYVAKKRSVAQISALYHCSQNKINYWLMKYGIAKRTIAEALYERKNPLGDPFMLKQPMSLEEGILFGMGLGLYWGEGAKRGTGGVRLTNSDPRLIRKFIEFLEKIFSLDRRKLRFSIQIHDDVSSEEALAHWMSQLKMSKGQFYKIVVFKKRGKGTYGHRSKYGVVIVYFNNIRLKRIICDMIEKIR